MTDINEDQQPDAGEQTPDNPEDNIKEPEPQPVSEEQAGGEEPPSEPSPEPAVEPEPEPEPEPAIPENQPEQETSEVEEKVTEVKAEEEKAESEQLNSEKDDTKADEPGGEVAPEPQKSEKAEEKPVPKKPKKAKEPEHGESEEKPPKEEEDEDFNYIVRIANTDLDGYKTVEQGLTGITGIGVRLASILVDKSSISRSKKLGKLSDKEIETLEEQVKTMQDDIPSWLLNRQKDFITGSDIHIYGPDIELTLRDDLNRLKMIRCYRGIRHEQGHKVRGQRTRANGRKGATVGVVKKAVRQKQSGGDKKK